MLIILESNVGVQVQPLLINGNNFWEPGDFEFLPGIALDLLKHIGIGLGIVKDIYGLNI